MLTGQKWKSSAIRNDCREAYRQALAAIDVEDDIGADSGN